MVAAGLNEAFDRRATASRNHGPRRDGSEWFDLVTVAKEKDHAS